MRMSTCCADGAEHIIWKDKCLGTREGWYTINGFSFEDHIDLYVILCQWCGKKLEPPDMETP